MSRHIGLLITGRRKIPVWDKVICCIRTSHEGILRLRNHGKRPHKNTCTTRVKNRLSYFTRLQIINIVGTRIVCVIEKQASIWKISLRPSEILRYGADYLKAYCVTLLPVRFDYDRHRSALCIGSNHKLCRNLSVAYDFKVLDCNDGIIHLNRRIWTKVFTGNIYRHRTSRQSLPIAEKAY